MIESAVFYQKIRAFAVAAISEVVGAVVGGLGSVFSEFRLQQNTMTENNSGTTQDASDDAELCSSHHESVGEQTTHSPAGFKAPDPELDDGLVVCAGCGEFGRASEMGFTADHITRREDDVVIEITRSYVHNYEDCMMELLGIEEEDSA